MWLLAAGLLYLARRPAETPVGARTLELGPEPPAVPNLLVNDLRVTADALPATLIDLAARICVAVRRTAWCQPTHSPRAERAIRALGFASGASRPLPMGVVSPRLYRGLEQADEVTVRATSNLGCVRWIIPVTSAD